MFQDLHYGVRMLLKDKMLTIIAVLSLAIGIGANTALFSAIDAILLRQLPVPHPEQLVVFDWLSGKNPVSKGHSGNRSQDKASGLGTFSSFSPIVFERLHEQRQLPLEVFAFSDFDRVNMTVDGKADSVAAQVVSGNYFSVLQVAMAAGRPIMQLDDSIGRRRPQSSVIAIGA
jgi:hypothetical protein